MRSSGCMRSKVRGDGDTGKSSGEERGDETSADHDPQQAPCGVFIRNLCDRGAY